jgi:CubicO group peptidase (beta-lactamase class C family)
MRSAMRSVICRSGSVMVCRVLLGLLLTAVAASAQQSPTSYPLPRATPEAVGFSVERLARIAPAMRAYTDSGKLGAVLVAVARRGQIAYLETFGMADLERRVPLAPDAVFRIYSMTKPITAVAVMQLVERGKLSLDDPVSRYVPAFAKAAVYDGGGAQSPRVRPVARPITVRDLLMHTSGMAYGLGSTPADSIVVRFEMFRGARTVAGVADTLASLPLAFDPGARWSYGPGLEVLGRIVEVVSGRSFERYLQEEIFRPLDMRNTSFRLTPKLRSRLVLPYRPGADGRLRQLRGQEIEGGDAYEPGARFAGGGGGLVSTAGDYLRFAQMLLAGGTLGDRRILRAESVAEMRRDALPGELGLLPAFLQGPGVGFGLGVSVQRDTATPRNPSAPGTFGWAGLFNTFFWIDPTNELIGMVWTQHLPAFAYPLQRELKQIVYEALANSAMRP